MSLEIIIRCLLAILIYVFKSDQMRFL